MNIDNLGIKRTQEGAVIYPKRDNSMDTINKKLEENKAIMLLLLEKIEALEANKGTL